MAYYNIILLIWTVTVLVTAGLQQSAVTTHNETDSSEGNGLIEEFNYVQALNRGGFASGQIDIRHYATELVGDITLEIIRELDCNYTYDMLVFMKVMTPDNYINEELCNTVDNVCPNWAQQMLNARINSGFPSRRFPYASWMFFFYQKRMKSFGTCDDKLEMNNLRGHVTTHFLMQMEQECKNLWPKNGKYASYAHELGDLDQDTALEKLTKACAHVREMSEDKINLDSSIYMNHVVENVIIMDDLFTTFGHFSSDKAKDYVFNAMYYAKNSIFFQTQTMAETVHFFKLAHSGFVQMAKIIMLRLCWVCLNNIDSSSQNDLPAAREQVQSLLYKRHFNDFADLFQLKTDDDFVKLIADSLPSSVTIKKRMSMITDLLEKYNSENDAIISEDQTPETLRTFKYRKYMLVYIAESIGYNIGVRSSLQESILWAEVYVEYLKKILVDVNFNILQSLEVFDRLVWEKKFVW